MPEPLAHASEDEKVWQWRYDAARAAGLSKAAARKLADAEVEASAIRHLADDLGYSPAQIVALLA